MGLLRWLYTIDRTIAVASRVHRTVKKVHDTKLEKDAAFHVQQRQKERDIEKAADDLVHEYGVIAAKGGKATADMPPGKLEALAREMGVGTLELMEVIDQRAKVRQHQDRHLGSVEREAAKRPAKRPIGFQPAEGRDDDDYSTDDFLEGM